MLKHIKVTNFRSLDNFSMDLNEGLNVIIGENDAGKTSLIDSIKILFNESRIEHEDFRDEEKNVTIEIDTDDTTYRMSVEPKTLNTVLESKPSSETCEKIYTEINSEDFKEKTEEEQRDILREHCKIFGIGSKSNSKIETLTNNLNSKLDEIETANSFISQKSLNYPISFLDGKEFENMNSFFEKTFFKELKVKIWDYQIEDKTIKNHLTAIINRFKDEALSEENAKELYENLSEFLPNFKEIDVYIEPDPQMKFNIDVNLLNSNGQQISLKKMGDGTNRRTTMAIFKHKQDKNDLCYVFDEPDTHLHIKAQIDIFNLFNELSEDNKQVIITTHSPFLINEIDPKDIKLLSLDSNNISNIKTLTEESEPHVLNELGINNIDLFFTNKLIIVEGESEQVFLPKFYQKIYNHPLSHKFVKIVKAEGIREIPNVVRITKNAFPDTPMYILMDNDSEETEEKLKELINTYDDLTWDNVFIIGDKEFEDTFTNEVLVKSINDYLTALNTTEERITHEKIVELRGSKYGLSTAISNFIQQHTRKSLTKPLLAKFLAENSNKDDVDEKIIKLFELL